FRNGNSFRPLEYKQYRRFVFLGLELGGALPCPCLGEAKLQMVALYLVDALDRDQLVLGNINGLRCFRRVELDDSLDVARSLDLVALHFKFDLAFEFFLWKVLAAHASRNQDPFALNLFRVIFWLRAIRRG